MPCYAYASLTEEEAKMKREYTRHLTVRVNAEMDAWLDKHVERTGLKFPDLIREALKIGIPQLEDRLPI